MTNNYDMIIDCLIIEDLLSITSLSTDTTDNADKSGLHSHTWKLSPIEEPVTPTSQRRSVLGKSVSLRLEDYEINGNSAAFILEYQPPMLMITQTHIRLYGKQLCIYIMILQNNLRINK